MPSLEDQVKGLFKKIPCRQAQIKLLLSIFGEKSHYSYPSVFIYGSSATGKSLVVNTILKSIQLPNSKVNCVECHNARLMYEHILNELSDTIPTLSNDFTCFAKCDNMAEFLIQLKTVVERRNFLEKTIYIVFDKAERFRQMEGNLLPAFCRLQELSGLNICVIFISNIVWEKFWNGTGCFEPLQVFFPDYTKDDLTHLLMLQCPFTHPPDFYATYINLLLSIFYMICRNLKELQYLATVNFSKFCEPVESGDATYNDVRKLWRNFEPHLKKCLQTVYLRETSSNSKDSTTQNALTSSFRAFSSRELVELPFYSKYLLIASYLASYNPSKTDKRFFCKNHGKIRKTASKKFKKASNQILGPKMFALDRLMAIFYSIVDDKVAPTANIYSQITSLVTLQMLTQINTDDQLDSPKYKCVVSLDFITNVARTVSFDIIHYLYDFV